MRINKVIAHAGICSRRKADELILKGLVKVDGQVVDQPGTEVDPAAQHIVVDGTEVSQQRQETVVVMLNKPVQVVSTCSDPEGRRTVVDLLPARLRTKRLYPVGRLDYFSEGLLLMTNDGALAHRLSHPRWKMEKRYLAQVREPVSKEMLTRIRQGMLLSDGAKLAPVKAYATSAPGRTILRLTLVQGVNRQIRRMCDELGLTLLSLRRTGQGELELGDLPAGRSRYLTTSEVNGLRKSVGLPPSSTPPESSSRREGKTRKPRPR